MGLKLSGQGALDIFRNIFLGRLCNVYSQGSRHYINVVAWSPLNGKFIE